MNRVSLFIAGDEVWHGDQRRRLRSIDSDAGLVLLEGSLDPVPVRDIELKNIAEWCRRLEMAKGLGESVE